MTTILSVKPTQYPTGFAKNLVSSRLIVSAPHRAAKQCEESFQGTKDAPKLLAEMPLPPYTDSDYAAS